LRYKEIAVQVYKNINNKQFNSEGLYKLTKIGPYLDRYKETHNLSFDSLVELSQSSHFKPFLHDLQSSKIDNFRSLGCTSHFHSGYPDFDLLMCFTFDGGSLSSFSEAYGDNSYRFDCIGLAKLLLTTTPQAFILNSGLRPSPLAANMYVSLVRDFMQSFPEVVADLIKNSPDTERKHLHLALLSLCKATGIDDADVIPAPTQLDPDVLGKVFATSVHGAVTGLYLSDFARHTKIVMGTENLQINISNFFLMDVFQRGIKTEDTQQLIQEVEPKARAWAFHLRCPKDHLDEFVNQLLASAFIVFPGHYERAGFCEANLMGKHSEAELAGLVKTVCDGPLAMLMKPEDGQNNILNCLEFLHELAINFSLTELYEKTGFKHSLSIPLLRSIGGHCPGVESLIKKSALEPEKAFSVLSVVRATDSYRKYSPEALDGLMSYYITRLPKRNRAGAMQPMACLEFPKDVQARVRQEFSRAYETNYGFKQLFVKRIEKTLGITSDHLSMFDLSHQDVPRTIARMHRKERGSRLMDEMGL
jgi:hypothetical protein